MRTTVTSALCAALCLLFALPAAAQVADTTSWDAKSLRGIATLHLEYRDSEAGAAEQADDSDPMDDPKSFLMDLLKSQSGASTESRSTTLQNRVESAIKAGTTIKLHEGTLAEAEAQGVPYLIVTVLRKDQAGKRRPPHDVSFAVRQQVQLARDPGFKFYATTFRTSGSDETGQYLVRRTLDAETERFINLWKAVN